MRKILMTILQVSSFLMLGIIVSGVARAQERWGQPAPVRDGGFEVEVIAEGRLLDQHSVRGRRYVEAVRGSEYAVRVRNPLPVRVAVALSVDGLNSIDARRTSRWDASKWVIEPYGTITINGWQMSSDRARRFYFTTEKDSYAAKLGRASDLGLITAVFFREKRSAVYPITPPYHRRSERSDDEPRVREESKSRADSASSASRAEKENRQSSRAAAPVPSDDDYAATGIGRSMRHDVRWMNLDLDSRPAAEVTIRYEYYDALVKLGVFPRPRPGEDTLRRRERARGFEDSRYCPEP